MRNVTVTCDHCGFRKTFNEDEFEPSVLKGWAYVNIRGPYTDMEICPECAKSFFDVKEIKEEREEPILYANDIPINKKEEKEEMIKTVQVEEKRCICDICGTKYYTMHSSSDTKREGWVHSDSFATTGKTLDICPTCADFLKSRLDDYYVKSVSETNG